MVLVIRDVEISNIRMIEHVVYAMYDILVLTEISHDLFHFVELEGVYVPIFHPGSQEKVFRGIRLRSSSKREK